MRAALCLLGVSHLLTAGCLGSVRPPEGFDTTGTTMQAGEHLLLDPSGDPEALLGREVLTGPHGELVIADERAPGCQVGVRELPSRWTRQYEADLGDTAVASVTVPVVADLRARYGRSVRTQATISNVKELLADLSGPCGQQVIKSVKVGTGSRQLRYRAENDASGKLAAGNLAASGDAQQWRRIGSSLSWEQPQAWAFTTGKLQDGERIRVALDMPTDLKDGDTYTLKVRANRALWLVALYREADGRVGILLPNAEHPEISVAADVNAPLPSLGVTLRVSNVAATEKLIVFAFTEREDYLDARPPAGAVTEAEAQQYLVDLEHRLAAVSRRRWARQEISYRVSPKLSGVP